MIIADMDRDPWLTTALTSNSGQAKPGQRDADRWVSASLSQHALSESIPRRELDR
jgi:hypothetical protein